MRHSSKWVTKAGQEKGLEDIDCKRWLHEIRTFLKAQGSAGVSTLSDYATRVFLDKLINLSYVTSTFYGAIMGGVINCSLNYRFVFGSHGAKKRDIIWRYMVIWVGSIILNTAGTAFFKEVVGLKAYYAMMVTSALVAVGWNYTLQRVFVFKPKKDAIHTPK